MASPNHLRLISVIGVLVNLLTQSTVGQNCGCAEDACCSQFGYCGQSSDFCGGGCQAGPCASGNDNMVNGDMLNGTNVRFKSPSLNKYVSAKDGGGSGVTIDQDMAGGWGIFTLRRISPSDYQFRTVKGQFLSCTGEGASVTATAESPSSTETFSIDRWSNDKVHIRLSSGTYLQASSRNELRADYVGTPGWDDGNAAIFEMTFAGNLYSMTCEEAQKDPTTFACQVNTNCSNSDNGYSCTCSQGFTGNPYRSPGCIGMAPDLPPDSSEAPEPAPSNRFSPIPEECENGNNGTCSCPKGSHHIHGRGCTRNAKQFPKLQVILGISVGLLVLFASCWLYFLFCKRKKLINKREQFYQQNGGLLLQQQLVLNEGGVETSKIFTEKELKLATNNYDESLVLGRGGYGTVYKGTLSDGRVVAIKKSKIADPSQNKQFINEVAILTKIHHRNVVKLLGCCLETEVPLLCYEYVSNGTLFQHIHSGGEVPSISWGNRLRIAVEIANALAYLHSAASIPIIHRDVKSANILLDEHYTAKIADFGASRLIPLDKKELATVVLGTKGYLDPEYFNTSQLTEKSDVYSFGVVLVELLTSKKPIFSEGSEDSGPHRNLAAHFNLFMEEDNLFEIVEDRVVSEGTLEQIVAVAELARRCLKLKGEERPTMRQVTTELESLRGVDTQQACVITSAAAVDPEQYSFGTVTTGSMNIPR